MQKLSVLEKKEVVAGYGRGYSRPKIQNKGDSGLKNGKFKWNTHNASLLALSSIPGLLTLGEGFWNLFSKKQTNPYEDPYRLYRRKHYGSYGLNNYADSRRDFFAYASQAIRPVIRFSPYSSKSGVTFAMPWFV